ncbi:unnamed protein product [Plutella xylostella]|uniref:(diamondback moth) hypothetical protein n=1 Tax=Plutella xylostella TaxID=51655 RepID=A0A8S4F305_PLUXY|nr:unnamed protein product [Plutella xylostella]
MKNIQVLLVLVSAVAINACGINEVETSCDDGRIATCKYRFSVNPPCVGDGSTGVSCICAPNYYKHDNGTCVPANECSPPHCGKYEVAKIGEQCGPACEGTCQNRGNPGPCSGVCTDGCFCKPNFVREVDGSCVPLPSCKNIIYDK